MVNIIFSKTDFFSKIFQSARNSHKVLPRTFKNKHKEVYPKIIPAEACEKLESASGLLTTMTTERRIALSSDATPPSGRRQRRIRRERREEKPSSVWWGRGGRYI